MASSLKPALMSLARPGWFGCLCSASVALQGSLALTTVALQEGDLMQPYEEDDTDPQDRAEFAEWKKQFDNNLQIAAVLYRDRPGTQKIPQNKFWTPPKKRPRADRQANNGCSVSLKSYPAGSCGQS